LQLAANFGELRPDHFHMGLDIRTKGREDLPVYAVEDGYVSHISVGQYGMGRALYIIHPDGYTTVYGHLNSFADEMEKFVHQQQYASQSWEQELSPSPDRFPVRQGQFIAYSGNTGASQAPHLHFEVRDTRTGRNLNPLLTGIRIRDELPPVINGLYWYDRRYSTYQVRARKVAITGRDGRYQATGGILKLNSPFVSLGISTADKSDNKSRLSGIFHAAVWLDGKLIYAFSLRNLSYSDSHYLNACIDYSKWIRSGMLIQHLSILPGNHIPIFDSTGTDGVIHLTDNRTHAIRIKVSDVYGNASTLDLPVILNTPVTPDKIPSNDAPAHLDSSCAISGNAPLPPENVHMLLPGRENNVAGPDVQVQFSRLAFYDKVPLMLLDERPAVANGASARIRLHDATVPVHDRYRVRVRTILRKGNPLRSKVIMQLLCGDSQRISKGTWQGDWMEGGFDRLGTIQLLIDTIPPAVELSGWNDGQIFVSDTRTLAIQCNDNLGVIASFRAELDGHWLLFARKGNNFTYIFDEYCPAGRHRLTVTVKDVAGNVARKSFNLVKE